MDVDSNVIFALAAEIQIYAYVLRWQLTAVKEHIGVHRGVRPDLERDWSPPRHPRVEVFLGTTVIVVAVADAMQP